MTSSQIYLSLPLTLSQGVLRDLNSILENCPVSCVLVRMNPSAETDVELVNAFVDVIQKKDVACLIENDWRLAKKVGADGVHLSEGLELGAPQEEEDAIEKFGVYDAAREYLGEDAIIGGLCNSRHAAMVLGEQGAQYVALPSCAPGSVELTAHEQIQWWVELFELPCIAWDINDVDEVQQFVGDGSDFINVGDLVWNHDEPVNIMRAVCEQA